MQKLSRILYSYVSIGNSMICSDIWHKNYELYFEIFCTFQEPLGEWNVRQFWNICQISRTNYAVICLYYYPQTVCNFHMYVFQIKLKYHCSKPVKLQKFRLQ